ncbi:hypothetical protein EYF80_012576 [Liparis tanakae]|uniref:Uncharacterized protein n=1 Tax=Liparis tanakae TaxID=230148 RepID=A0A4Z2IGW3_9TELE|nr:hypothetical protein EYF80_012576 [Liparis tanakae]
MFLVSRSLWQRTVGESTCERCLFRDSISTDRVSKLGTSWGAAALEEAQETASLGGSTVQFNGPEEYHLCADASAFSLDQYERHVCKPKPPAEPPREDTCILLTPSIKEATDVLGRRTQSAEELQDSSPRFALIDLEVHVEKRIPGGGKPTVHFQ